MDQLTQTLKNGKMKILEVPFPSLSKGSVMARNYYSVISSGTEGRTVKDARASYIGKAKSRPKEVKQVLNMVRSQGLKKTYNLVMNKLNALSPLGYSCAGEVIGISEDVTDFKLGDFVACGGSTANHAEVVVVPKNLCTKIPKDVELKHAAFTTLGAIALQGIRQAELSIGENCVVIGLGLIGQLTMQLLNAAGIKPIGIDIDAGQVKLAKKAGILLAFNRNQPDLEEVVLESTNGFGTDAVIISAGTSSHDPVELAGVLCRKKGKVIIVGVVPTGFSRENYYKKELDLRMSCSYGPGRYDAQYEEKGIDYPIGYVRWTEARNMQAFINLLKDKKINLNPLITHTYDFEKAPEAYKIIIDKSEVFSGILLKYDVHKEIIQSIKVTDKKFSKQDINIGFIGVGSFAQNILLPAVQKAGIGHFVGLAEARSHIARNIADKYRFSYATGNEKDILNDDNVNTVFIATRHNLHAELVLEALKRNKNVYVEKPLCMTLEQLDEIKKEYEKRKVHLMVGYNRRFAPFVKMIKSKFSDSVSKSINYRINAGILPIGHWIHDKEIGGGRIIGEVCHFIDLAMFLAGSSIKTVSAILMENSNNLMDTLMVNLSFLNGSIASISYFSNGNDRVGKELLEVFSAGKIAVIDDFKKFAFYNDKGSKRIKSKSDKGHYKEIEMYLNAIKKGLATPISFNEIYLSSYATFKVVESIKTGNTINI